MTSPLKHTTLHGGADGDDLVGIDTLVRLLAKDLLDQFLDRRHPRLPPDENDLVDVAGLDARILDRLLARSHRTLQQIFDHLLQLGSRELDVEMLRTRGVRRDERQVDLGLLALESSILAFSAASLSRCTAIGSWLRSIP